MTLRGWSLFIGLCIVWGIPYLLIKVAVRAIAPADLVFARTAIGTVILLPFALRERGLGRVIRRWKPLVAFAALEIGVAWFLLSSAEQHISSSLSALVVGSVPLTAVIISRIAGTGESISSRKIFGLSIGFIGVAAIVGFDFAHVTVVAIIEMAIVVCCYAGAPQIVTKYLSDLPSVCVITCSLALCAVGYAPAAVIERPVHAIPADAIVAVVLLGIFSTAIAFLIAFRLFLEIGVVRTTVVTYVNPAVALVLGILLLHEQVSLGIACGFVLVIAGSVIANTQRKTIAAPA